MQHTMGARKLSFSIENVAFIFLFSPQCLLFSGFRCRLGDDQVDVAFQRYHLFCMLGALKHLPVLH